MNDYYDAVVERLKAAGYAFKRHGRGDHQVWVHPVTRRVVIVDGKIKSRHSANETLKQAKLPKAF